MVPLTTMRRALGKGMSQLLGEEEDAPTTDVPVGSISPNPRQPRKDFDSDTLSELAMSIKEHGVLQPLVVRQIGESKYELIAGERRLRAAKLAGLRRVPIALRTASAQASLELAVIENVQREDINAIECAIAYRRLIDEFSLTQDQVATKVGKSRVSVANTLRLLKLPQDMQDAVSSGQITEGHARALLMVDSPSRQMSLFERAIDEELSVRELERMARGEARAPQADRPAPAIDPDWESLTKKISDHFGARIKIDRKKVGGRLSIEYFSDDELEGILHKMGVRLD